MYPITKEIVIRDIIIINTFFLSFKFLNRNNVPRPALAISPARVAPKPIPPNRYNSLIIMLDAQLGIRPIVVASSGDKYLFAWIKPEMLSSPINSIKSPKIKLINRIYKNSLNEWNSG